jgi:hypothetical protein
MRPSIFWTDFVAIMEGKDEISQFGRSSVLWEPACLLICQPMRMSAANTRFALTDDHWPIQWQGAKNESAWDGFPLVPVARQ